MTEFAPLLMAASAAVVLALGAVHLLYTFVGVKLHPRDARVREAMDEGQLVLTRQTTLWRAWIGFNASHAQGAILFGLVFGFLALRAPALLFESIFLRATGLAMLASYLVLAHRYWFKVPFRGVALATLLYGAACVAGAR
jgi:hypothetical protein